MKPKVYLAGPLKGLLYDETVSWRSIVARDLSPEIEAFSPMRGKEYLKDLVIDSQNQIAHPLTTIKGVTTRDRYDVLSCDLLFVNVLRAERVSIGTVIEIAWADMLRKPIVLVMEEGNIHDHLIINEMAGFIVPTLDQGVQITKSILLP